MREFPLIRKKAFSFSTCMFSLLKNLRYAYSMRHRQRHYFSIESLPKPDTHHDGHLMSGNIYFCKHKFPVENKTMNGLHTLLLDPLRSMAYDTSLTLSFTKQERIKMSDFLWRWLPYRIILQSYANQKFVDSLIAQQASIAKNLHCSGRVAQ